MIPIIGKLHRERDVTVLLHSRSLVNKSVVSILKTHRFARQIAGEELSVTETLPFLAGAHHARSRPVPDRHRPARRDLPADDRGLSVAEFTAEAVAGATGANKIERREPRDVVLYGFGRIGRLVARLLIEKAGSGNGLRLRAIVVRGGGDQDIVKRASLLRRDSIHGQFQGTITVDEANSTIIANGNEIKVIYAERPVRGRLHGVRHQERHPHRQHRQVARPRGPVEAPAPRHRQGRPDRAGQGRRPQHRARRQPRHDQAGRADPVLRVLHHQRDRPAAEGDGGRVRRPARPRGDRPLVHQRPEPAGQLPQGRPPRPFGAAQHGHHRDRCRLRRRQGAARPQGADHRQLDPGPGAGRLDRDPQPAARAARPPARRSSTTSATSR